MNANNGTKEAAARPSRYGPIRFGKTALQQFRDDQNAAPNKYNARLSLCKAGHNHKSRAEVPYCDSLRMLLLAKKIKAFKYEKGYDLHGANGKKVSRHYPDFTIEYPDGRMEIWEVKGFDTGLWKLKAALFQQEYCGAMKYILKRV